MKQDEHIKNTGGAGAEIHQYMDQFYFLFGQDHRVVIHHELGLKLVAKVFGPEAIPIAEQHIRDDWDGWLPIDMDDRMFYRRAWAYDMVLFDKALAHAKKLLTNLD